MAIAPTVWTFEELQGPGTWLVFLTITQANKADMFLGAMNYLSARAALGRSVRIKDESGAVLWQAVWA